MQPWVIYAFASTLLASISLVLAKYSIEMVSTQLGLSIRTAILFLFALINLVWCKGYKEILVLSPKPLLYLIGTGITTGLCWICHYKAIEKGSLSIISSIDRGGFIFTITFSVLFLDETVTPRLLAGVCIILIGIFIVVYR